MIFLMYVADIIKINIELQLHKFSKLIERLKNYPVFASYLLMSWFHSLTKHVSSSLVVWHIKKIKGSQPKCSEIKLLF